VCSLTASSLRSSAFVRCKLTALQCVRALQIHCAPVRSRAAGACGPPRVARAKIGGRLVVGSRLLNFSIQKSFAEIGSHRMSSHLRTRPQVPPRRVYKWAVKQPIGAEQGSGSVAHSEFAHREPSKPQRLRVRGGGPANAGHPTAPERAFTPLSHFLPCCLGLVG
jgi:hypothetical protein